MLEPGEDAAARTEVQIRQADVPDVRHGTITAPPCRAAPRSASLPRDRRRVLPHPRSRYRSAVARTTGRRAPSRVPVPVARSHPRTTEPITSTPARSRDPVVAPGHPLPRGAERAPAPAPAGRSARPAARGLRPRRLVHRGALRRGGRQALRSGALPACCSHASDAANHRIASSSSSVAIPATSSVRAPGPARRRPCVVHRAGRGGLGAGGPDPTSARSASCAFASRNRPTTIVSMRPQNDGDCSSRCRKSSRENTISRIGEQRDDVGRPRPPVDQRHLAEAAPGAEVRDGDAGDRDRGVARRGSRRTPGPRCRRVDRARDPSGTSISTLRSATVASSSRSAPANRSSAASCCTAVVPVRSETMTIVTSSSGSVCTPTMRVGPCEFLQAAPQRPQSPIRRARSRAGGSTIRPRPVGREAHGLRNPRSAAGPRRLGPGRRDQGHPAAGAPAAPARRREHLRLGRPPERGPLGGIAATRRPAQTIQSHVSNLRRALGKERIENQSRRRLPPRRRRRRRDRRRGLRGRGRPRPGAGGIAGRDRGPHPRGRAHPVAGRAAARRRHSRSGRSPRGSGSRRSGSAPARTCSGVWLELGDLDRVLAGGRAPHQRAPARRAPVVPPDARPVPQRAAGRRAPHVRPAPRAARRGARASRPGPRPSSSNAPSSTSGPTCSRRAPSGSRRSRCPTGVSTFLLTDIVGVDAHLGTRARGHGRRARAARRDPGAGRHASAAAFFLKSRGEGDSTFSVFTRASDAARAIVDGAARAARASTGRRRSRSRCAWSCTPARRSNATATTTAAP